MHDKDGIENADLTRSPMMALTFEQFQAALEADRQKLRRKEAPAGVAACAICDVPLQESITGNRVIHCDETIEHVCSDCYFEKWGEEIDHHPIAMPRRTRGT